MIKSQGGIVATARMGSSRFPGKTLTQFIDKPLIAWVIERLQSLPYPLVIATSKQAADNAIVDFAQSMAVPTFRGSEPDVLARLQATLQHYSWQWLVRISGDSPLIDPKIILQAINQFETSTSNKTDIVTNLYPVRTYASGFSVELITAACFTKLANHTFVHERHYREHVTTYAYQHPEIFVIEPMKAPSFSYDANVSFCIDAPEDLKKLAHIASKIENPDNAHYRQWLEAYQNYCI